MKKQTKEILIQEELKESNILQCRICKTLLAVNEGEEKPLNSDKWYCEQCADLLKYNHVI